MTPTAKERLIADVKHAEGFRAKAYQDTMGVWTIGYGTNLEQLVIPEAQAETWCIQKLDRSELEARATFSWFAGLSDGRQRAIVEMVYNLGLPRFRGFVKLIAALSRGDYAQAAEEALDSRWAEQVGSNRANRIADLVQHG
jgi:lysozyme